MYNIYLLRNLRMYVHRLKDHIGELINLVISLKISHYCSRQTTNANYSDVHLILDDKKSCQI